jgi:hypothetical protein
VARQNLLQRVLASSNKCVCVCVCVSVSVKLPVVYACESDYIFMYVCETTFHVEAV